MKTREITVLNRSGLQSKPAALFIQKAATFKSSIWIEKGERKANAKSLLGLLSLGVGYGMKVILTVEGEDEEQAIQEMEESLRSGLGEEV